MSVISHYKIEKLALCHYLWQKNPCQAFMKSTQDFFSSCIRGGKLSGPSPPPLNYLLLQLAYKIHWCGVKSELLLLQAGSGFHT